MSCISFATDKDGFSASIEQEKPNLVFFSIPYHEGWRAYVNGEEVDVEKVNIGFMAVECGAGHSDIRFEFETPMLKLGTYASVFCIIAFIVYALFFAYNPEKGKNARLKKFVRKLRTVCHINEPESVRVISEKQIHFDDFDDFNVFDDFDDNVSDKDNN